MTNESFVERHKQLRHLRNSLESGSITRQEYDELLPFLASPTSQLRPPQLQVGDNRHRHTLSRSSGHHSSPPRRVRFAEDVSAPATNASPPEPVSAPPQYRILSSIAATSVSSGLQLRCPACGTSNDTGRGPRCYVCNSRLTIADSISSASGTRSFGNARNASQNWPIVSAFARLSGAFTASQDGRVMIDNGFFSCVLQDTQIITTALGETCQVFVMCCTWQPQQVSEGQSLQTQATWYVSQRFRQFEKLHKMLKRKLARSSSISLPPFPAKYHLLDRLEKRKQGLATYMTRLLELCANLPTAQPVPELDEFLDVSHQIQLFRLQHSSVATAPTMPASSFLERSVSTPATLRASSFLANAATPSQALVSPMDETELAQAEGAVRLLAQSVRTARGDVRSDGTVQHHLDMCVQLAPALQCSVDLDNPFANAELVPRAMQCQEELHEAVAMYNDSLLAVLGVAPSQHRVQPEPHVQAQQVPVGNIVPASAA